MPKNKILNKYNDFLKKYIELRLEDFFKSEDIEVIYEKADYGDIIYFYVEHTRKWLRLVNHIENEEYTERSSSIVEDKDGKIEHIDDFKRGSIEDRFFKFIIQQFLSDINSLPKQYKDRDGRKIAQLSNTFKAKQLIERFQKYSSRPAFSEIGITNIIKSNTTQNYKDGVTSVQSTKPTIDKSLNFNRSENKSVTSAMGEMGTVSPGNSSVPGQMPKISKERYRTSISNTNFSTTTPSLERNSNFTQAITGITATAFSMHSNFISYKHQYSVNKLS